MHITDLFSISCQCKLHDITDTSWLMMIFLIWLILMRFLWPCPLTGQVFLVGLFCFMYLRGSSSEVDGEPFPLNLEETDCKILHDYWTSSAALYGVVGPVSADTPTLSTSFTFPPSTIITHTSPGTLNCPNSPFTSELIHLAHQYPLGLWTFKHIPLSFIVN